MTKFGETWWKEKEAGAELRKIMNPGAKLDLAIFSRLDTSGYLKELCAYTELDYLIDWCSRGEWVVSQQG